MDTFLFKGQELLSSEGWSRGCGGFCGRSAVLGRVLRRLMVLPREVSPGGSCGWLECSVQHVDQFLEGVDIVFHWAAPDGCRWRESATCMLDVEDRA
jgi:hypothetical protein